jgi:starch-binding outer membrane protein, SusD/RagB family
MTTPLPADGAVRRALGVIASVLLATTACGDFLVVENPNTIDVATIDPVNDATALANSAQQNFAAVLGSIVVDASWFVGETDVTDSFVGRIDIGRRDVTPATAQLNTDIWQPLSAAMASTKLVLDLPLPNPTTNLNHARVALWRGYGFVFMAEQFCRGAVDLGPELSTAAMLDSAVAQFTRAMTIGTANGTADGTTIANTARVGRARAHLQAGRKAQAAADAEAVPAGFVFNMPYVDDLGNRARLSNRVWQFTQDRPSMSVAPYFRVTDPRVRYKAPGQHNLRPNDGLNIPFFVQDKYASYSAPIRVASRIEADYVRAEAGTTAEQLALIQRERAANGQPPYAGPTDAGAVLTELMEQRGREFFLEGRRLGDWRRNPTNTLGVPATGTPFFKPGFAPIGSSTCYPLPVQEIDNNPNF